MGGEGDSVQSLPNYFGHFFVKLFVYFSERNCEDIWTTKKSHLVNTAEIGKLTD